MSGRIYDQSGKATCKKCGSDVTLSSDRNFWGPKCNNPTCNGGPSDVEYDLDAVYPGTFMFYIKKLKEDIVKNT